jgi:hypothetical protein
VNHPVTTADELGEGWRIVDERHRRG